MNLQAKYPFLDLSKERIVYSGQINDNTSSEPLASAKPAGKANRKWHDKFKAGRK